MGQLDYHIHHQDCIEGMAQLGADSVDIVVTSPPYNLGINYNTYKDKDERGAFLEWCRNWGEQLKRVLKPDGSFFLNVGAAPSNPLFPHEIAILFSELFTLQNTFHWIKSISVEKRDGEQLSVGHFKPINSKRYVTDCHEYLFHFTLSGSVPMDRLAVGVPYQDKSNINRWGHTKGKDKRCRGNTWFVPYQTIQSRNKERPHPATFPVQLAEQCIQIHGVNEDTCVMDPFLGIGHSAIAAAKCNVPKFIGFDIDEDYLETAKEVLKAECGIVAV